MSSHKALGRKTNEENFTVMKPEVGNFHIFGFLVYSHVPSVKRMKLDPTKKKGIFVGYSEISKSYKIYIPSLRKVKVK